MIEELHIRLLSASTSVAQIELGGFLNLDTSETLYDTIHDILSANAPKSLIFYVSNVKYVSSAGVGVFMSLYEQIEANGGKIAFVGLSDSFRRVLNLLGFHQYFGDCTDEQAALGYCSAA